MPQNLPTYPPNSRFEARCLSIDLEVSKQHGRIHQFAAVRGDSGRALCFAGGSLSESLRELEDVAEGAEFLLGHNLIAHDVPHLVAAKPDLRLLSRPALDTLRLNPLAFPRNPYHHLVKHYQDGQLLRGRLNDPELDARLTLQVLRNQIDAFSLLREHDPDRLLAWHWLTSMQPAEAAFAAFFAALRQAPRPAEPEARASLGRLLSGKACQAQVRVLPDQAAHRGWAIAYALAWLSVEEGHSVLPPWVLHQFPDVALLVAELRDTPCGQPDCGFCRERHDPVFELKRYFGFEAFRPEPVGEDGRPLQQVIVEAAMRGRHVLGILPTGTGKSLCYQIPALSRYEKTGALTVVISPLVALMADQVAGLETRGITSCVTINGMLSMPERADALDRIRLGDVGILLISPEQLRSRSVRRVLAQRAIGAWVLDEAHCISKWGHDFRPDYRYVGRFIRERASDGPVPPILCLTATAKPDVVEDIVRHFQDRLGVDLAIYDGGASRSNLEFVVAATSQAEKLAHVHQVLMNDLPADVLGGAIVYCATRKATELVSGFLKEKGVAAEHFHAGLPPETKKDVQRRFIAGELRVIAATNAFGMGIDKPDVRLVIHADIPGSLENYLQEAGRAGRDRQAARCVLLYDRDDVERQFRMSARSRLTQREIQAILKSLRRLERQRQADGEVIATPGEILSMDEDEAFERDRTTDDTRVRTAVSWLEEAALLTREENQVQIFPSSLRVASFEEARRKLEKAPMTEDYRQRLLKVVSLLLAATPDEGLTTDELMAASGLDSDRIRQALHDLEHLGIASNDTVMTVFVHAGVERSSRKRFEECLELECALIDALRAAAPDLAKGESSVLNLRHASHQLKEAGIKGAIPERLRRAVQSLAADGRQSSDEGLGSLRIRRLDAESWQITLQRDWHALAETARIRRDAAKRLLDHLLAALPPGARGTDLLAETTMGNLLQAIVGDLILRSAVKKPEKLLDRALMWLHEQEVIRLHKGLTVFRPAMIIRLDPEKRGFVKADFMPLRLHYDEQILQIHVMAEFVQRGLEAMAEALRLAMDYFTLNRKAFLGRWLAGREQQLARQTTPDSWQRLVEHLRNPLQQRIVSDERERTNVLVLAGPGSGKTRVLVHRIAYLIRIRREHPEGILALAYNRHAVVEIRRRLQELIGDDARGVNILTGHALAMRLAGVRFDGRSDPGQERFGDVLTQAVAVLKGEGLSIDEADGLRERILSGLRWILVDEYQDIGPEQYALISALTGRTSGDPDARLSLFAVGDDDQNIYAFNGSSVEFIQRFEEDYQAKPVFLLENYRSTHHVIEVANRIIQPARGRLKADQPITVDRARRKAPQGGIWERLDPVAQGRVQVLHVGSDDITQAMSVMAEFERMRRQAADFAWSRCAVIAREWKYLHAFRAYCERAGIPVQVADEDAVPFWRLRETQALQTWLRGGERPLIAAGALSDWLAAQPTGPWWALVREAVEAYRLETDGAELPIEHFLHWLADWGREVRRRQAGLLLLTAHRAKGLEFDHVAVLDGGWEKLSAGEDEDAPRRLYYVAMTRARMTLALARFERKHPFLTGLECAGSLDRRPLGDLPLPDPELAREYRRLSMREIFLSFAGKHPPDHPVHGAIAALSHGSPLSLRQQNQRWELLDAGGKLVGVLASRFQPPPGKICVSAQVHAVVVWRREDCDPSYQASMQAEQWGVVLPELVFAPATGGSVSA